MSTVVREFSSFGELLKSIDDAINMSKALLAEFLRRLEDVKAKSEQDKRLRELIKKLTGEEVASTGKTIDLKDVKLIINPDSIQEAKVLEEVVDKLNRSLQALQSIRKVLEPLMGLDIEAKIIVIYTEGIPSSIMVKFAS